MRPGRGQRAAVRCSQDVNLGGLGHGRETCPRRGLNGGRPHRVRRGFGWPAVPPGRDAGQRQHGGRDHRGVRAQQYHAWQNGPAHSAIINFEAAQEVLDKNSSGKPALIAASLNVLGQQAAALASFPVPSCADPRGIFAALLSQIVSVTGEVGPDATLADLQQAINQLGSVFSLESDFTAEVKQTTGT